MVFAFAPIVALLLGLSSITVPWTTLLLSVVLYIVVPVHLFHFATLKRKTAVTEQVPPARSSSGRRRLRRSAAKRLARRSPEPALPISRADHNRLPFPIWPAWRIGRLRDRLRVNNATK
jgi:hypothetical protein